MAKDSKEGPQLDPNSWMTTYTDLMVLLLTFFVLLLSIAVVDVTRKKIALQSLLGAFGFKPGGQSIMGSRKGLNVTLGAAPLKKEAVDFENLRNVALRHSLKIDMTISKVRDRTVIVLSDRILFKPRSSELEPKSLKFLEETAKILREGPQRIELRGYAANGETVLESDPQKEAMYLSTKRAFSVFRFFHDKGGIPAQKMFAHGFGLNRNRKKKDKKSTQINRQVEIILDYHEEIAKSLAKPKNKDSVIDFKGFLFRVPGRKGHPDGG
ncbi:flagellar motor protein MotB [Thermodesulfobacteriota bacterium]